MKQIAFEMKLIEGNEAEYKKRHDEIWPELVALLKTTGISEYAIYLNEETGSLFGVMKVQDEMALESTDFESAVRLAISLGGDSDTLAAITGSIAEAFYGMPLDIAEKVLTYLDDDMKKTIGDFYRLDTVSKNMVISENVVIFDNFQKLFG